ncbi:proteasome subunit beta type 2, putative [Entamoeba histolytica HM-1:IMSS-B]|uniref:Proteasome subunit beta n=9 Tax=Entamoeba TaxID=5758 RepID=C4M4F3_ENTH1|nr:proteasome subunit beta type, putative [Entamoeba dispar SAW760]XP_008860287.1 proteasome subunit beta type 2, putative [Entamoeba nuttalli P19]XP_651433.1 proteasome beta subunit, putative [Entamoeba histolytica HM-1:IMSS]EMD43907.1 proteasome subunit beta type, putative [Entamoeba histolytica KU27]EMH77946.1 proteasome subunit beta type 2, putative [Entamoeba histolytica HM-1:IMSS-B]EMS15048.1 proteasome subunit beta type, putative [Entamoeba histolytica HM-3:IMSS]ENY60094.1 proteasome s|eukprot:EDR27614.1 proteasome subunit beta type, putative [Entamoeba dispar SAW760]
MDSCIGIVGKDFVLMAVDGNSGRGVITVRNDFNKIYPVQGNRLLTIIGEGNDRQVLADFVQRNIALNYYRNGLKSTTQSIAHWIRRQVSDSLREGGYQCSMLLGGVDEKPELFMIDQFGTLVPETYASHGIGSNFVYALLDKNWHSGMEFEEALELMKKCIKEIQKRVIVSSSHYCIEVCYKDKTELIQGPEVFPPVN